MPRQRALSSVENSHNLALREEKEFGDSPFTIHHGCEFEYEVGGEEKPECVEFSMSFFKSSEDNNSFCIAEFILHFPPFPIDEETEVEPEPPKGKYGVEWESEFSFKWTVDGEFTVGGEMGFEIAAKEVGTIHIAFECVFIIEGQVKFKEYINVNCMPRANFHTDANSISQEE